MFLKELPESVYEDAVLHSGKPHFMQSSAWGEVNEKRNYTVRRIGLFDGDVLKGTALLLEKKILRWKSYYCPRGFLCDYSDHELVKEFIALLKDYVKKNGGLYLKTDADILIRTLNDDGTVKETYEDNLALLPLLTSLGGKHKGFTTRFVDTAAPRFTFRVSVDKTDEEFLASFHSTTRNILKRNNPYHLHFVKGGKELIPSFYKTMKETSLRKQMYLEPESFFEDFHEILHKHDMSDVYIVYALKSELLELYKQKKQSIDTEKEKLLATGSKKALNRLKDFEDMEKKLDKELAQVQEMDEEKIVLSGMITAKYARKP
ncbi:MAG: peptidoglycan bridge formation glycyltransferase FemA/FemB family protein [Erysipelotrichaceae bacterium]|nr:peptidoglycan bridge formation glycyltransferase FemA/FemB family protein [Erysipelotrichaceae bacterium]